METVLIQEPTVASVEQGPYIPVMADIQDPDQLDRESQAIRLDTIVSIARAAGDRTSLSIMIFRASKHPIVHSQKHYWNGTSSGSMRLHLIIFASSSQVEHPIFKICCVYCKYTIWRSFLLSILPRYHVRIPVYDLLIALASDWIGLAWVSVCVRHVLSLVGFWGWNCL
jgi:hypothetical protein